MKVSLYLRAHRHALRCREVGFDSVAHPLRRSLPYSKSGIPPLNSFAEAPVLRQPVQLPPYERNPPTRLAKLRNAHEQHHIWFYKEASANGTYNCRARASGDSHTTGVDNAAFRSGQPPLIDASDLFSPQFIRARSEAHCVLRTGGEHDLLLYLG